MSSGIGFLPDFPLVCMARIGSFEVDGARLSLEHWSDDVLELDVVVVRSGVVAPAHVQPHLVRRQALDRLVHRLDRHRNIFLHVGRAALAGPAVRAHREVGRVELEVEAGVDDRLVFRRQRLRGIGEIGFVGRVVLVGKIEQHLPGRHRRHERIVRISARAERCLEVGDVALDRVGVAQRDRPFDIRHHQVPAGFVLDEQFGDDFGEIAEVGGDELRAVGEAVVALHHIIAEADLAHLAVGDDVDTCIALLLHSLGDRFHDSRIELALIDRLLIDQVPHHAREIRRTGQAAGMRRLNAIGAPCNQPGLEPILRRRARAVGGRLLEGHEVSDLAQDADGVTVTVKNVDSGAESKLRGKYLIGADGAHSHVRELLEIPFDGRGVFSNSMTIYFEADLAAQLLGKPISVIYINNPVLGGFFRFHKDCRSGFLGVNTVGDPKADPVAAANPAADISEKRLIELVRAGVGDPNIPVKITGVARWRATSDVARKFQKGRVFLAGDAAHLMPPNGGFGGNTGIHDAHNLAWKLALVLKGIAGPELLSTYETERKPVGKFTVEQAYTCYVTRTASYLGAKDFQPPASDFNIELGYLYRSPAIVSDDTDHKGHG